MFTSVAVIGLGRLGLPMAAAMAAKGLRVSGVDVDHERVGALNAGMCPLVEPGLEELIRSAGDRLSPTTDAEDAVQQAEATFVVVPTPSRPDGSFSLDYVIAACETIGRALRKTKSFHLVVLTSTVSPGSTDGAVRNALENASEKSLGGGFGLAYSPEFVALGSVIENFLRPDFVLIGESDERSGELLEGLYARVCENAPKAARMSFVNAEITKLAVNTFLTTKISFANMLAEMCGEVSGGDVDVVTSALGMDERIGARLLKGGLGYGGPCFPRDNRALAVFARSVGVEPCIPEATDAANEAHMERVLALVRSRIETGTKVAVLGLSYKPLTDVVEQSQGMRLASALAEDGVRVAAFDPIAGNQARSRIGERVVVTGGLDDCLADADVVVVATPWETLPEELASAFARIGGSRVVIDCWRTLDPSALTNLTEYVGLGIG